MILSIFVKGALHSYKAIRKHNRNWNVDKHYIHWQIFSINKCLCLIINNFNDKTIIAMGAAIFIRLSMVWRHWCRSSEVVDGVVKQ